MSSTVKIMLIDDESINNFISTKIIERFNPKFHVIAYTRVKDALEHLRSGDFPDIIFLDINMPEMDGWDFLDQYSKFPEWQQQKCPVAMLTSSVNNHDIQRSKSYDAVANFISKPLTVEALEQMLCPQQRSSLWNPN